jgi:hypothetical protein
MEVAAGLEPAKTGFADQRLAHFGKHAKRHKMGKAGAGK